MTETPLPTEDSKSDGLLWLSRHRISAVQKGPLGKARRISARSAKVKPTSGDRSTASSGNILERIVEELQQTEEIQNLEAVIETRSGQLQGNV